MRIKRGMAPALPQLCRRESKEVPAGLSEGAAMYITDIEISHYRFDPHRARHCANVAVSAEGNVVNLYCQIDLPEDEDDVKARAVGFAGEAARQLRRMPEIRSGRTALEFASGLEPRLV